MRIKSFKFNGEDKVLFWCCFDIRRVMDAMLRTYQITMGRAYYKCTLRFSSTSNVTDTQGFAYCRLPGVSGTVHTTLHIEWTPAIREDDPLVLSMRAPFAPLAILGSVAATASFEDGTFQNVSYLPTFCSTLSSQSCCVQSLITPHNRPDPSHRWAIDGPDACILNGQPTYESPPATPPTDSSVP